MNNERIIEALKIQPLTEEEKSSRHILGRLYGPIATTTESTRNGRKYNRQLWEKALSDPLMSEKIKNKSLFLELGHPLDGREETIMANACACIPELPKIVDGDLIAYVDILDTPNGRILKTLCDYGFQPGISSRGSGDVIDDEVDPDTFNLETWDIVQMPAVEKARLSMTESLDENAARLKTALTESLNSATAEDKKIMEESLHNLGIDADCGNAKHIEEADSAEKGEPEATDGGLEETIKALQEAVTAKAVMEREIKSLQEQLAVSNTKVSGLSEELGRFKSATVRLSSIASEKKRLAAEVAKLTEELESSRNAIKQKDAELTESKKASSSSKSLAESISVKDRRIKGLTEAIERQRAEFEGRISECESRIKSREASEKKLNEELKSSASKITELNESLTKAVKERDDWKKTAVSTVNSYIKSKATMLGVEESQIRNMLPESYSLRDIDDACGRLIESTINRSRLPFIDRKVNKIKITESKNDALRQQVVNDDDEVSDGLLRMSGIK